MPPFPTSYPTGCLLGVVDLQTVVTQEDFKKYIPKNYQSESVSPHVFVLRNPRRLATTIRVAGQRGVFQLTEQVVESAVKNLERVPTDWLQFFAEKIPKPEKTEEIMEGGDKQNAESQQKLIQKRAPSVTLQADRDILKVVKIERPQEKLEIFMEILETQFFKVIEKEKEKKIEVKFDSYLEGFNIIVDLLKDIEEDVHQANRDLLENSLPKKIAIYSFKSKTQKFNFKEKFTHIFTFGKSIEMKYDGHNDLTMKNNQAAMISNSSKYMNLSFSRILKTKKKGKFSNFPSKISGESLLIGFF